MLSRNLAGLVVLALVAPFAFVCSSQGGAAHAREAYQSSVRSSTSIHHQRRISSLSESSERRRRRSSKGGLGEASAIW